MLAPGLATVPLLLGYLTLADILLEGRAARPSRPQMAASRGSAWIADLTGPCTRLTQVTFGCRRLYFGRYLCYSQLVKLLETVS